MSRKMVQRAHAVTGMLLASAMLCATGMAVMVAPAPQARAVSVSEYQNKVADHAKLKAQLSGVSSDLADTILQLADLNDNQIPAAVEAADAAHDDAKAAVAQLARQSFHGSDVSDVLDVVTNSTTTDEFVNKMQSEAAVTRSETNAASDAANDLNTSMNREERLSAIEDKITQLKTQADEQAASAQQAASDANAKKEALQQLRDEGAAKREQLEAQKSQLTTQSAREAADIVAMKSQIDSWNNQYNSGNSATPNPGNNQQQSGGNSSGNTSSNNSGTNTGGNGQSTNTNTGGNTNSGSASGMDYSVPGSCPSGSGYCYGHNTGNTVGGSAYPARQCTLWAYLRRSQLGLPVGSYMGNGAEWANTARSLGYLVNNTPHYGAVMVFARGQSVGGHWTADWQYGHVAVVERVNADGSVLISEGGTGFSTFPAWETISNAGAYQYIHY